MQVLEALDWPSVLSLNPCLVYNKVNEFHTLVEELQEDCLFMSESWKRESESLDKIIQLEDFQIISNVYQRLGRGGRLALIINTLKCHVDNLTTP